MTKLVQQNTDKQIKAQRSSILHF